VSLIVAINPGFGSSIGVFKDGAPLLCVEEERFNRVKNWLGFPEKAFQYIFEQGIAKMEEVDYFVLTNLGEIPTGSREEFYAYYDEYFAAAEKMAVSTAEIKKYRLKKKLWSSPLYRMVKGGNAPVSNDGPNRYEKKLVELGVPAEKIRKEDHHLCHAAAAYYGLARSTWCSLWMEGAMASPRRFTKPKMERSIKYTAPLNTRLVTCILLPPIILVSRLMSMSTS